MPVFKAEFDVSGLKTGAAQAKAALDGVASSADNAAKSVGDLWQDKQGRWRNKIGQFASDAEKAAAGIDDMGKAAKSSTANIKGLGGSVQDATANIKSLAVQLVGLVGVYKTLEGAMSFVKRGVDFNASLEASGISIASVVSATNNIVDAQGKALTGVEKFNAAQGLSKEIMDEIQVLALQTTATFDSLADGVAGIIAPATKAGVEIEKLPKFAVNAAQAMTTMRIPVQQMRTEIESLLSGNINKAQDLLATNLGITGEMVRNWQKQGTLVDELNKRMSAFAIAGEKVADSWEGLKGNMEDALNFLSGTSGKGIFEGAKQSYRELLDLMVNTEGKVGVGKDLENIMGLITELQDAIGEKLVEATREFIEYLQILNRPENVADLKESLLGIWQNLKDIGEAVSNAGELVGSVISSSLSGWNSMPDIVKELGIVGAVAFGWGGRAALASIGIVVNQLGKLIEFGSVGQGGGEAYKKYWTEKNKQNISGGSRLFGGMLDKLAGEKFTYTQGGFVGPSPQRVTTSSAIGTFKGDQKKTGKTEAEKFAENSYRYAAGLEKLRNEVTALEAAANPALTTFERMTAKITAERDAAIKNADVKASETVRRKEATAAQAEETAGLEKRKATLEAQAKLDQLATQNLKEKGDFYKELAAKTGEYSTSEEYQIQLLEKQRQQWESLGIPIQDVTRMLEVQRLELARDPWSGIQRGMDKYYADATNYAMQMEKIWTSAMDGMTDSLTEFVMTGKLDFQDLANDFIRQVIRMQMQAAVSGLFKGIGSVVGGLFGGGGSVSSVSSTVSGIAGSVGSGGGGGGLFSGISAGFGFHEGGIVGVDSPTFTRSVPTSSFINAPRFHSGGGFGTNEYPAVLLRGERVLNQKETYAYNAGKYAASVNSSSTAQNQSITINFIDSKGNAQSQTVQNNGMGNMTLDVMVGEVDKALAQRVQNGTSQTARAIDRTRGTSRAGQLYRM